MTRLGSFLLVFAAMLIATSTAWAISPKAERAITRQLNLEQADKARQANDRREMAAAKDISIPGAPPSAVPTTALQISAAPPVQTAPQP